MVWRLALCHTATEYRSWDLRQLRLAPRTHWTRSPAGLLLLCLGKRERRGEWSGGQGPRTCSRARAHVNWMRKQRREEREAKTPAWYSIWYLRQGQGGGGSPPVPTHMAAPPYPRPARQTARPATLLTALTSGTAERDSGTCSGRRGAQTAKTRQGR